MSSLTLDPEREKRELSFPVNFLPKKILIFFMFFYFLLYETELYCYRCDHPLIHYYHPNSNYHLLLCSLGMRIDALKANHWLALLKNKLEK